MRIYLACTVRGDRGAIGVARELVNALERQGHTILTRHLLEDDVDQSEAALSEQTVFERDLDWLGAADVLIAEASGSSYGVGFEVGYVLGRAETHRQRVILLYDGARRYAVSRLIAGNNHPACTTYAYRGREDLVDFVTRTLACRESV